jgi:clan AA aspartic protease
MIGGAVNADKEAVISLTVHGPSRKRFRIQAVIDTGFDGFLSLPTELIERLALPWKRRGRAQLADGSDSIFDIHEATVVWDRRSRTIPVDAAETMPLVGMALMDGYALNIQIRRRGRVTLKKLAR